jgi:hypothetical protein
MLHLREVWKYGLGVIRGNQNSLPIFPLSGWRVQTIGMGDAAVTLVRQSDGTNTLLVGNILYVDPNSSGASEILKLPPEGQCKGVHLVVVNTGGEGIAIQNDAAGAIVTVNTGHIAFLYCDGTTWYGDTGLDQQVQTADIADEAVTAAKLEKGLLEQQTTTLTSAQIKALNATPITVVTAPGAGYAVIPLYVHLFHDHGGTDYVQTAGTNHLALEYTGSTEILELGTEAECTAFIEAGADAHMFLATLLGEAADFNAGEDNKGIDINNNEATEYTTGDGVWVITVSYITVDVA